MRSKHSLGETTPSAPASEAPRHFFNGAATPPLGGGEYAPSNKSVAALPRFAARTTICLLHTSRHRCFLCVDRKLNDECCAGAWLGLKPDLSTMLLNDDPVCGHQ